jgi:hypothetical protein
MKRIIVAIVFLTITCNDVSFSQDQENSPAKIYCGISLGCSPVVIGFSALFLDYGAQVLYAYDNQYFMFSYNRVDAFNLKFDSNQKDDNSKMDRLELNYGRVTCLKENHKLLSHIIVGAMIGLAYNSIRYYKTDIDFDQSNATKANKVEIPLGVTISNPLGKQTFMAFEMKYHILSSGMSYPDFKYSISFNMF